jgi:ectoine hydroxylase-related dioxygenase (phytanoyl-CoA dioxygenase family)
MIYELKKNGFLIVRNRTIISQVKKSKKIFHEKFKTKFVNNFKINRELIKRFADHPFISSIFTSQTIMKILKEIGFKIPVKCGTLFTHYTSNDMTGNSYGLPYHQDYPSMASSKYGVVLWLNLVDSNKDTHGIEILPGQHLDGLLKGKQKKIGYVLEKKYTKLKSIVPSIKAGDLLIMSSFLPHKTFIHPNFRGWKLSLSQRYDDLSDKDWGVRGYKNAYQISVDRKLYLNKND